MFGYSTDTIFQYRRERFPLRVFAPVAAVLTFAAFAKGLPSGPLEVVLSLMASLLLLFQFRLWDDLSDRDHDRVHHPDRVLSRCGDRVSSFHALVALSGLTNCMAVIWLGHSSVPFLIVCGVALFWYAGVSTTFRGSIVGRHLLMLKYPTFVWLIAPSRSPEPISAMAIVYVCSALYELLHDRAMRLPGESL